eukprot:scaffold2830_cov123-Isochrysis_galbana.AAC.25
MVAARVARDQPGARGLLARRDGHPRHGLVHRPGVRIRPGRGWATCVTAGSEPSGRGLGERQRRAGAAWLGARVRLGPRGARPRARGEGAPLRNAAATPLVGGPHATAP